MANQNNPNVGLGKDPSNLLYQFASSGGGFTQLQRSATDLGGAAGEALATTQIIQQGIQSVSNAVGVGMNIYTDEKARQFKGQMLDKFRQTEKDLMGVDDPIKHKEIYQKSIDDLNTALSEAGIMKKDDLDRFNELLSQRQDYYNNKNDQLTKQQLFSNVDINTNKTIDGLFSVAMDFPESVSLMKHQYEDNYNDALKAGFSQTEAKQIASKTLIKMANAGANSIANPLNQSVFYRNFQDKDKDGKWIYFHNELSGEDRQHFLETIKHQGGIEEYKKYDLDIELNKFPPKKQVLGSIMMDDQQKARLLSRIDNALQQRAMQNNKQIIDKTLKDNLLLTKTEFANVVNANKLPDKDRDFLIEKHNNDRDELETGDAITKYIENDPALYKMPRDIVIQQVRSHGGNQDSILTNQEMNLTIDHLNNSKTLQDKLNVINFQTPEMKQILQNANIPQERQNNFIQKYKFDILRQMKNSLVSDEEKTAIEMMSRQNNNDVKNVQVATQLLKNYYNDDGQKIQKEKNKSDIDSFKKEPAISLLSSYKATEHIVDQYINSFKKSGISKSDFINALGLDAIQNNKYSIIYNKNDFKKKDLLNALDNIVNNDIYYDEKLIKDKYTLDKVRQHGKWISLGHDNNFGIDKGFVYLYGNIPILQVNLDYSDKKPQLKMPVIKYDKEIINQNADVNQVYPDGIKNNVLSE